MQFESIHPFVDDNGRVGRLLIALLLHHDGVLRQPLLYLSLYFKQNRAEYYRLLNSMRDTGDWEAWLDFFLEGVRETATGAVDTAHRLLAMFQKDQELVQGLGRAAANTLRVFEALRHRPVGHIDHLAGQTGIAYPTAARAVDALVGLGVLHELTARRRGRVFAYDGSLRILNEGGSSEA